MGKVSAAVNMIVKDIDRFLANQETIKSAVRHQIAQYVYQDVQEIFKQGVDEFYNAYQPKFYKRTNSLYDAYNIYISNQGIDWDAGGHLMSGAHRADNGFIYELAFNQGYHGGALGSSAGVLWRTPHPLHAQRMGMPAYSQWGFAAPQSKAPSDYIWEALDEYENSGIINDYANIVVPHVIKQYLPF